MQLSNQASFIEADIAATEGMHLNHLDFTSRYGMCSSRYNDYRKLRDSEELRVSEGRDH